MRLSNKAPFNVEKKKIDGKPQQKPRKFHHKIGWDSLENMYIPLIIKLHKFNYYNMH